MVEHLSIVIPAFNEELILRSSLLEFIGKLKESNLLNNEIILVENGSTDKTFNICQELAKVYSEIKVLKLAEPNYGKALRKGITGSRYPKVVLFNVDFWDVQFLKEALLLLEDYDCVIGSKVIKGATDKRSLQRRLITSFLNIIIKLMFGYKGTDTHGIKVFRQKSIAPIADSCFLEKELFDTELMIRAQMNGLSMVELPVEVKENRPSRYFFLKRAYYSCRDLVRLYLNIVIKPLLVKE